MAEANRDDGPLKSRLEIALERLKKEAPEEEPRPLSDDQKERIAAVRRECQAKLAEAEILHKDAVKKELMQPTAETVEKIGKIREVYGRDRAKLQERMEKEIEKIRREGT
jgi:hypothetical protein